MGCAIAALFFYQFWLKTKDRLFGIFASAFAILSAERIIPISSQFTSERHVALYVLRLIAFLLILYAIVDKNFSNSGKSI